MGKGRFAVDEDMRNDLDDLSYLLSETGRDGEVETYCFLSTVYDMMLDVTDHVIDYLEEHPEAAAMSFDNGISDLNEALYSKERLDRQLKALVSAAKR